MSARKRKRSRQIRSGNNLPVVTQVGRYAGHIFISTVFLLLTLLPAGGVSILTSWLPAIVDDPVYLGFAWLLHVVVLVCDGLLFAFWMLCRLLKAIMELS
ncbi:hypothetical protein [Pseudoduganella violacea]|uniref:Uncharacterized protein n=1 Tax=Pseudoduganella violacea TaxID=1715466 RepID=A0A7W5B8V5_9BURK|nr:hypothetical protein [Pseudoduganella violacea]MBB3118681.1 hypothetical protein [Pseudoduganella violacea]